MAERTGLTGNNAPPLFDYGASVRRELEQYVRELEEEDAAEIRTFDVAGQQYSLSARKLLGHILMHEIRHWAQIALAVRLAGLEPPSEVPPVAEVADAPRRLVSCRHGRWPMTSKERRRRRARSSTA